MKNIILGTIGVLTLAGFIFFANVTSRTSLESDENVVTTKGIHWHPTLTIYVDGAEIDIPANVGLAGGHAPIHTHDEDVAQGVLHFEFGSVVKTEDLQLQNFFTTWSNKNIATAFGRLERMTVNGEEDTEFGEYVVQSEDTIELFYESESTE